MFLLAPSSFLWSRGLNPFTTEQEEQEEQKAPPKPQKFTFRASLSILFENKDYQFCERNANIELMRNILLSIVAITIALSGIACGGAGSGNGTPQEKTCTVGNDTPTEAYKRLYAAVKAKNTDNIKTEMSKKTQEFAVSVAQRQNNPVEKIYENGFTGTTFSETLPEIRDERVGGCSGAVEVRNTKEQIWEDLPFVAEDGMWKFGLGELFGGSFKSPGKGRDAKEKEAANAMRGNAPPPMDRPANGNTSAMANANAKPTPIPKYDGPQVEPLPKKK